MEKDIDKLCENGHWYGPTGDELVKSIESILNVTLPADYRYFILKYGSGSKSGLEIAGYHPNFFSDLSILGKTVYEIRDYYFYPQDYLFISDTGDGGQICLDRSDWSVHEVYQDRPKGITDKKVAENFLDFIRMYFIE
jgi:hypothetical protein